MELTCTLNTSRLCRNNFPNKAEFIEHVFYVHQQYLCSECLNHISTNADEHIDHIVECPTVCGGGVGDDAQPPPNSQDNNNVHGEVLELDDILEEPELNIQDPVHSIESNGDEGRKRRRSTNTQSKIVHPSKKPSNDKQNDNQIFGHGKFKDLSLSRSR